MGLRRVPLQAAAVPPSAIPVAVIAWVSLAFALTLTLALALPLAASPARAEDAAAPTGAPGGSKLDPETGRIIEERDYDMWEGDSKADPSAQTPPPPVEDAIPTGDVKQPVRPKDEGFLAPPPEFDAESVIDPQFAPKDVPPGWEDVSPEEMRQLRGEGKDPLAKPAEGEPPPPPPLDCSKGLTLECFIAELNAKITAYDYGKLGHTGCNRIEARMLTGGLKPAYRMDFTGETACEAHLLNPFPEPPSDELRAAQAEQLDRIRVAVESFCRTWSTFGFGAYVQIPSEGDVRLVETENGYYRIYWDDAPREPLGPMPTKYSEFIEWKRRKAELEKNRPKGTDVYILIRTDRSEIKRIEKAVPMKVRLKHKKTGKVREELREQELKTREHFKFSLKRGHNLLSWYRYLKPDHRATGHVEYRRVGDWFLPSSVRVDYFPADKPGYFVEAAFSGCGFNRPKPKPAPAPAPPASPLVSPPPPG